MQLDQLVLAMWKYYLPKAIAIYIKIYIILIEKFNFEVLFVSSSFLFIGYWHSLFIELIIGSEVKVSVRVGVEVWADIKTLI